MKYLTNELYCESFAGKNCYYDHNDKFLIGFLNSKENKLKDVITGEIIEGTVFQPVSVLLDIKWIMAYIVAPSLSCTSIRHCILAEKIQSIISKDLLEEKDIIKIKKIMNKEIIRNFEKEKEKEKELKKYSIDESERNF